MTRNGVAWCGVFIGMLLRLHAAEVIENPGDDEWEKEVRAEGKAAEEDFATWKTTGKLPESFEDHAIRGAREDLVQRQFSGDKLAETEIKTDLSAKTCEVTVRDTELIESSIKEGNAWIVSVGSEHGRGFVKLTPDGKGRKIDDPWLECFPQQLRSRGMFTDRYNKSDDGSLLVNRTEAGHGMHVGWPHYHFLDTDILIPNGDDFGNLPESWSVFIESDCGPFTQATEDRKDERTWFFDAKGIYQHWSHGRTVGTSLPSGGLWIRQLDDSCSLVEKGHTIKSRMKFSTKDQKSLIPVELHDDIGLGLFLLSGELVLGTWGKGLCQK